MVSLRALIAALLAASALGACTPIMRGAVDTLRLSVATPSALVIDRAEVMARPSYQMRLDSPFGSAIMLLARVERNRQYWVTSSNQVLVIEQGLIRRTSGFPENLEETRFIADDAANPLAVGLHRLSLVASSIREVDWMPGYRYGVRILSRFQRGDVEEREILGERLRLLRIDEDFRAEDGLFSGRNRYWVDPGDGFVYISEQVPLPGLQLRLTQLRPYRESSR